MAALCDRMGEGDGEESLADAALARGDGDDILRMDRPWRRLLETENDRITAHDFAVSKLATTLVAGGGSGSSNRASETGLSGRRASATCGVMLRSQNLRLATSAATRTLP